MISIFPLAALTDIAAGGSLLFYLLWLVLLAILTYAWVVMPFTLSRKFDELIRESRRQTELLETIARNSEKAATSDAKPTPAHRSSVEYEMLRGSSNGGVVIFVALVFVAVAALIIIRST